MKKTTCIVLLCIFCGITACVTFMGARYRYLNAFLPRLTVMQGEWQDSLGNKYTGDILNGVPYGNGKMEYTDGSIYEGHFTNGLPNGHGKFTKANGSWAEGNFCNSLGYGNFKIHSVKRGETFDTLLVNTPLR